MKFKTQLLQQIKKNSFVLLKVWFVYLFITGLIIGIGRFVYNIPVGDFTQDPNSIIHKAFYFGSISNLGIILWTAAATLCIFSSIYLKRYNPDSPFRLFLLHGGIFTMLLLLDDVYMWHDEMFPDYLGISQRLIYLIYFMYTLFFLIRFTKVIFKTEYIILLASILLLSLSVFVDVVYEAHRFTAPLIRLTGLSWNQLEDITKFFEDTSKGMGILTWLIYFSRTVFINVFTPIKNSGIETQNKINSISNHLS